MHLEITSKCQASCPMCARNIQGGPINPFLDVNELSYNLFVKWFDTSFITQLDRVYMCGNYGDPVVAKDTVKIFEYIRQNNPTCRLSMNTNGSARNKLFWIKLANLGVSIRFGIDGLDNTHSRYRIGTDWNKVILNSKTFIDNGGYAIWDMLVFEHNKHQVEVCKQLSIDIGFSEFHHKNTSRFRDDHLEVINFEGKKVDVLYPTEKSIDHSKKVNTDSKEITCRAVKENSLYIGANGNVTPCCWTDLQYMPINNPSRIDMNTRIGNAPNLHNLTLDEIFNTTYFNSIKDTWSCNPLKECAKQCGSFKKFEVQYES